MQSVLEYKKISSLFEAFVLINSFTRHSGWFLSLNVQTRSNMGEQYIITLKFLIEN
jgi:hypothetical protein